MVSDERQVHERNGANRLHVPEKMMLVNSCCFFVAAFVILSTSDAAEVEVPWAPTEDDVLISVDQLKLMWRENVDAATPAVARQISDAM